MINEKLLNDLIEIETALIGPDRLWYGDLDEHKNRIYALKRLRDDSMSERYG